MKTSLMLMMIPFLMTAASSHAGRRAELVTTPLIQCTPSDHSGFKFVVLRQNGCRIMPGGERCGDKLDIRLYGFDPNTDDWGGGGSSIGYENTARFDKARQTFEFHYTSPDSSERIDIDVHGATSTIDVQMGVGFYLLPEVNTHGPLTTYQCTFF